MSESQARPAFRWYQERLGQALLVASILLSAVFLGADKELIGAPSRYAGLVPLICFVLLTSRKRIDCFLVLALILYAFGLHSLTGVRPHPIASVGAFTCANLCLAIYFIPYLRTMLDISLLRSRYSGLMGAATAAFSVWIFPTLGDLWFWPVMLIGSAWLAASLAALITLPFAFAPLGTLMLVFASCLFVMPERISDFLSISSAALLFYSGLFAITLGGSIGTENH